MKRFYVVMLSVLLSLCIISCKEETQKIPAGVLSKDKMVALLTDVHLAEASYTLQSNDTLRHNRLIAKAYEEVLKRQNISYSQFRISLDYYLHHPTEMDKIYEQVVNKLTTLESKTRVTKRSAAEHKDSLP